MQKKSQWLIILCVALIWTELGFSGVLEDNERVSHASGGNNVKERLFNFHAAARSAQNTFVPPCATLALSPEKVPAPGTLLRSGLFDREVVLEEKSRSKAFFLSLLVPGLGERYVGATTKSRIFMATEVALWLGYISQQTYSGWREEDYRAYASAHAGVVVEGKVHGYFIDVGNYLSIDDYNAAMLRDRNKAEVYFDTDAYYWRWPSEQHRVRFLNLRVSADNAEQRSVMLLGVIFANHLISAIDATWSAYRHNKRVSQTDLDIDLHMGIDEGGRNIRISACKSF